ncbi:expressed unknown protein [Seminavis robusta]|uniref:Uncharacterized protein n=1 Tax=Seminavis robusta TaxID=568900 RepID=A0A9N8H823_9STRA|nr:expressed unknown protein [Seminavis robusta]|eukprot:Sro157_g071100.1 n/a (102) ;mRNA; r:29341-29831
MLKKLDPSRKARRRANKDKRRQAREEQQWQETRTNETKNKGSSIWDAFDFTRGGLSDRQTFLAFVVVGPAAITYLLYSLGVVGAPGEKQKKREMAQQQQQQ